MTARPARTGATKQKLFTATLTLVAGKGMAGLAVERNAPVNTCNIQTDTTGDVRAGAKATGLEGAIVVPITRDGAAVGALGIAGRSRSQYALTPVERHLGRPPVGGPGSSLARY